MAETYTRLAALRPTDTNEAELYAVSASQYIVATLFICNQDSVARTYRVALCDDSGAASGEEWLEYDTVIPANTTYSLKFPAGDGDTIRVKASAADVISFVLAGLKIT